MKVIAITGDKGGGGRSTICIHLAVLAATQGDRVLAIDIDPNRSLTHWYSRRRQTGHQSLVDVYTTTSEGIADALAFAEMHYDQILIDTPRLMSLQSAPDLIKRVDFSLVPVQPSICDLETTPSTIRTMYTSGAAYAFVLNAVEPRNAMRATEALQAFDRLGAPASPFIVWRRQDIEDALVSGSGASEFAPDGASAREVEALWDWTTRRAVLGQTHSIASR